jgi:hypothetical protein
MNDDLIYIVNINDPTKQVQCNDYAQYSLKTWEYYCKKHGIDLIVCTEHDPRFTFPVWNKEKIWEVGHKYEKIGIVDSDTMIRWDAPNIFDLVIDGIYGVNDLCDLNWVMSSINDRQHFYPNVKLDLMEYLNAGVLFFDRKQLDIFEELYWQYLSHQTEIDLLKTGGKEQTLLNFTIQKMNRPVRLLDPSWNLLSIHRKNMFQHNWQLNIDKTPYFIKYAYVWHFTGFPIENRVKVMSDVWDYFKLNYEND